jgi:hypothetical protein
MITGSCGHTVEDMSQLMDCSIGDYDEYNQRCVYYVTVCKDCHDKYEKDGIILYDEGEENKWLRVKE